MQSVTSRELEVRELQPAAQPAAGRPRMEWTETRYDLADKDTAKKSKKLTPREQQIIECTVEAIIGDDSQTFSDEVHAHLEELVDKKLEEEIEVSSPLSDLIDDRVRDELQKHEIEIGKMIEAQMELVLQGDWFVESCAEHLEKLIAPAAELVEHQIEELVDKKLSKETIREVVDHVVDVQTDSDWFDELVDQKIEEKVRKYLNIKEDDDPVDGQTSSAAPFFDDEPESVGRTDKMVVLPGGTRRKD